MYIVLSKFQVGVALLRAGVEADLPFIILGGLGKHFAAVLDCMI